MCLQVFRSSPVHAPVRQPPVEELLKGKADQIIRDYRGADPARRGAILMALGRQRQKGDRSTAGILARIVSDKSLRKLAEKPCRTIVSETLKQTLHRRHGGWVYEEPQVSKLMQLPTFLLQLGAPNGSDERKLTRRVLVKYLEWINHDHDLYEKRATETEKEFGQFRLNYLTWRDEYRRLGKDGLDLSAFLGERHGKLFTSSHMFEQRSDPRGFLDRVKDPKTPDGLLDLLVRMYDARTDQRFDQCREKDVTRELKVHETSLLHWQQTIEQGVTENQGRLENFQFLSAKSISETLTREIERLEKEISAFEVDPMSALSDVDEIDNPKLKQLLLDYGKMVGDRDKREKSVQTTVSEVEDTNKGLDPAKEQVQSMLDQVRDNLRGLENGTSIYSQHVGGRSAEPSLSSDTGEDINFVGERKEETKFPKTEEVIVRGAKPGLMQRLRNRFSSGVTEIRRWFGNALSKIGATIAGLFGRTRSPDSVTDFVEVNGAPNSNSTGRSTGLQGVVYVKTEQNDDGMKFLGLDYKEIDEEPSVDEYIYAEQNNEDILFSDEEDEPMVGDDRPGPDEDLNKTVTPEEIKANIKKAFKDSNISNEIDPELENIEVNVTENISNSDANMDKDVNVTESGNVIKSGGN